MSGTDLKIARIRSGVKQIELARRTQINPSRLSKIENGWEEPRAEELKAIHDALGPEESSEAKAARALR